MTNPLPSNRGDPKPCSTGCGEILENCHIFLCQVLNPEAQGNIEHLLNGTLKEMKTALNQWQKNMKKIYILTDLMDSV